MRMHSIFQVVFLIVLLLKCIIGNDDTVTNSLKNRLALQVMKVMPRTSVVVSTLALRFSLGKLASVADGDAKQELMSVLGYKSMKMVHDCHKLMKYEMDSIRQFSVLFVNKIYVNYSDDIKPNFYINSSDSYGVSVEKVGFKYPNSARTFINRWVETATYKRITDMLNEDDLDPATTMITLSALHFKPSWEFPFDFKLTNTRRFRFYNSSIIKSITMMSKTNMFDYLEHEGCKILRLNLATQGTFVIFAVPSSPQGLPDLIEKLYKEPDYITNVMGRIETKLITIHLPLFQIKTYIDYTGFLQEIGLNAIFSEQSGLNSILQPNSQIKNIQLNKAKQKVFVEFDETGTLRHTVDSYGPGEAVGRVPPNLVQQLVIDCPFYFTVNVQNSENTIYELFNGVYYGPE